MDLILSLNQRWQKLGQTLGIPQRASEQEWERIRTAYSSSKRHYHNLTHLGELFALLEEVAERLNKPEDVELAIWYHDLVYNPMRQDNEGASARKARKVLEGWGIGAARITRICQHIEATAGHQLNSEETDQAYFLDADLAILGSRREKYKGYTQQIRKEYAVFPNMLYNPGRKKVLEKLLDKPQLYFTPHFHTQFEAKARENMEWEIQQLS